MEHEVLVMFYGLRNVIFCMSESDAFIRVEPRSELRLLKRWSFLFFIERKYFMGWLKEFREQASVIRERDPAIKSNMEIFLYPSYKAIKSYKKAHKLYKKGHYVLARWISQRTARKTGIEIHPGAVIGKGLFIDHGHGVVIGETTIIGDNVTIYQGVTLGGTGKETGKRHPTIEDNVMISVGAKILGSFTIGENSKIGAGSVVLNQVPPNSTVVGVPGRVVKRDDVRIPRLDLDQIHYPDPVTMDLLKLHEENEILKKMLADICEQADKKKNGEKNVNL